jgi:hypothetical protein
MNLIYFNIQCKLRTIIGQTFLLSSFSTVYALARLINIFHQVKVNEQISLDHLIRFRVYFFNARPTVDYAFSCLLSINYYSHFFYLILCGFFLSILISASMNFSAYGDVCRIV